MKRFLISLLSVTPLLAFAGCDDDSTKVPTEAGAVTVSGVCKLSECPKPETGIACCTPDAQCGMDATGLGLGCTPNPDVASDRVCTLKDCPMPLIGDRCCTGNARCGWDPFGSGLLCLANAPQVNVPDGGFAPTCDLNACPQPDSGGLRCCLPNGACGQDPLGINFCLPPPPPPLCDLTKCEGQDNIKACCQLNGECGLDVLGVGICFPPPTPLCDLDKCPQGEDGGAKACCQLNGQCGFDTLGIGICFPPPAEPTCDLSLCPSGVNEIKPCCLPNGTCGLDALGIGICFPPAPPLPDGGIPPVSTEPPDDPSITGECPSFLGVFGPQWGCCSDFGVCGTFSSNACLLAVGTQIPSGPPPAADSGKTEPFLRCTPPPKKAPDGGTN